MQIPRPTSAHPNQPRAGGASQRRQLATLRFFLRINSLTDTGANAAHRLSVCGYTSPVRKLAERRVRGAEFPGEQQVT